MRSLNPLLSSLVALLPLLLGGCAAGRPTPPIAPEMPQRLEAHGHVRLDEYYGMRERTNPEVIAYLEAENAYYEACLAPTKRLQEELFEELKNRERPDDASVPYLDGGYWYSTRYEEGAEYPRHGRRRGSLDAPEELLLDENALAAEQEGYFSLRGRTVSPNARLLAYGIDRVGRRFYTIRFKDLETGKLLDDVLPDVTGNLAWANDNRTVFYTRQDPGTLRSYRIYRHVLGNAPSADELVFEERDDTFSCRVQRSKSERFLFIASSHTLADEVRYLDANDPGGKFRVFLPRARGHEYSLDHFGDHFYLRTNDGAENFRLVRTPIGAPGREQWEEVVPARADVYLQSFEIFRDHLVVSERREGLIRMRVIPGDGSAPHELDFGEPAYSARPQDNHEFDTSRLRFAYSSMTTPNSVYDYDMTTREKTLLKRDEIRGGFDPAHYRTERLVAPAADGAMVPISLVYRIDRRRPEGNPLLLNAYGSYGSSSDASFRAKRISLLDRGFICAIAHVRGGQERGREWYEHGKLLKKMNTFTDFIACSEHLVAEGYTRPDLLFASGGSAGGLLMGAIANLRPDLYRGIVAHVPFVDVITTMLDDSIPLTTSEFDEWGDPKDPDYYEYMLSYSPYDQVEAKDYPNLLVTTGLHDSQVQYWEPAKWVARLRARKTDDNLLFLKTDMEAGHGGPSGRYQRHHETALVYAFLLHLLD